MKMITRNLIAAGFFGAFCLAAPAATTNYGTVTLPFSVNYGDSFTTQAGAFVDDFVFTLSPAGSFDTIAATIDLGSLFQISNLQSRLYQGSGSFISGTTPLEQAWSTPLSASGASGSVLVINPISLPANTYTLEVIGNVTGTSGGSYNGAFNIAALPVPEPGNFALMLGGLALVGGIVARRRKAI